MSRELEIGLARYFGNALLGLIIIKADIAWLDSLYFLIKGPQLLAQQYVRLWVGRDVVFGRADLNIREKQELLAASEHPKAAMSCSPPPTASRSSARRQGTGFLYSSSSAMSIPYQGTRFS